MRWYTRLGMFLRSLIFGPSGWLTLEKREVVGPNGETRVEEWLYDSWGRRLPARRDAKGRLLCPGCGSPLVSEGGVFRHKTARRAASARTKKKRRRRR